MGEGLGCSQKPDVLFGLAQGRRVELALCSVFGVSRTRTKERVIASGCTISLPRPPKPNRSRGGPQRAAQTLRRALGDAGLRRGAVLPTCRFSPPGLRPPRGGSPAPAGGQRGRLGRAAVPRTSSGLSVVAYFPARAYKALCAEGREARSGLIQRLVSIEFLLSFRDRFRR